MKTKIFAAALFFLFASVQFAQHIVNTLGVSGQFTIKDASTTYFTLSQSTGNLSLLRGISLSQTTSSTTGIIFKNGVSFIHNYAPSGAEGSNTFAGINSGNFTLGGGSSVEGSYNTAFGTGTLSSNTTGYQNSALGVSSLKLNTAGTNNTAIGFNSQPVNTTGELNTSVGAYTLYSNITGSGNSAFGVSSMLQNTTGSNNSAFGYGSLSNNSTGTYNVSFGYNSLNMNTTGNFNSSFGGQTLAFNTTGSNNISAGYFSMFNNITGFGNTAIGNQSLFDNTDGINNTSTGYLSLNNNTSGSRNTAVGTRSLFNNTTGSGNTALGNYSLFSHTIGINNTAIGDSAGSNITTGSNNIAIGFNSQVPLIAGSNQVRIGNTSITSAGIQVAWTITSDMRLKSNIINSTLGLNFISKLRPVSYLRKNDVTLKTEYGFIAQEVDNALKSENAGESGLVSVDDEGIYSLRYNDLLAPMVKAMQELNEENRSLKKQLAEYEETQKIILKKIESLESAQTRQNENKLTGK
jgi:hypothetical protein